MKNIIISLSINNYDILHVQTAIRKKADLVIINGKVLTIDKDNPVAEAIAIKGEKIIAVGTSSRKYPGMIDKGINEGY